MKNLCCTLLFATLTFGAAAQKIAVKNNLMTVDGRPYARIEPDGGVFTCTQYYINSVQNERLFAVKTLSFNDPANICPSNPTGNTDYLQFVFPASHVVVETPVPGLLRSLSLARKVYAAQLLKNGVLDPKAVADFAFTNGLPFSARRRALDQVLLPAGY